MRSIDGISKPVDALEYEIQIHEIEKLIPDVLKMLAEDGHGTLVTELESGDIMGKGKLLCLSRSFTFFGVERSTLWKLSKCLGECDNH
jgi:hypothetical protein